MRGGPHERRYSTLCRHFDSISIVDVSFIFLMYFVSSMFDKIEFLPFCLYLFPTKDHRDVIIDHRPLCNDNYGTPAR